VIVRATIYSLLRNLLGAIQFFLISVLVIQFTSLDNWGAFISLYLVWSFFVMIINTGTKDFLVKTISKDPRSMWLILSHNTTVRLLLSIITCLIVLLLPQINILEKVMMLSIILLRVFAATFEGFIVYEKAFKQSFYVELGGFVVIILLVFLGNILGALEPIHIFAYIVVSDCIKIGGYQYFFRALEHYKRKPLQLVSSIKEILPFFISGFIGFLMSKADLYIFSSFAHDKQLIAQYHILNTFSNLIFVAISSITTVRSKAIFRMPLHRFRPLQLSYFIYSLVFVMVLLLGFYIVCPMIFQYKVSVIQVILIGATSMIASSYLMYFFMLTRFEKMEQINMALAIAAVVNIISGMMLIPNWGIEGALTSVCLSNVVVLFYVHHQSKKYVS